MKFSIKAKQAQQEAEEFKLKGDPNIIAIIDGDEIAFKIAAACETNELFYKNNLSGESVPFKHKTQFKKFMEGVDFEADLFTSELVKTPEPIQNAIVTIKRRIKNICDKCGAGDYEIYVGDTNNFRHELPLPVPYKDRETSQRPILLKDLKKYLQDYQDAEWVDGMEADDMISIKMFEGYSEGKKLIGISGDKDQMMTEGYLFSPEKMEEPFLIEGLGDLFIDSHTAKESYKGWGRKFLYYQCGLVGDKVDTYCPRDVYKQLHGKKPRFGEKTAYNLLEPCTTDRECLEVIFNQYKEWYGEEDFEYLDYRGNKVKTNWYDLLSTYFLAAYMRRYEDDTTTLTSFIEEFANE